MMIALIGAAALAKTPVELWHTGDDGYSSRLAGVIEEAFNQTADFEVSRKGELIILAPSTNVDVRGGTIDFAYQITRDGQKVREGEGQCSGTALSDCAKIVVGAAREVASK